MDGAPDFTPKQAQDLTRKLNAQVSVPPWDSDPERALATKNQLVKFPPDYTVPASKPVWTLAPYGTFEQGDAPPEVNPSLWRNAKLNNIAGLFMVVDGVYQVRGLDLSVISFLECPDPTKVIVVDPLVSQECAADALNHYRTGRANNRQVAAVIYTHSHLDHYGGVRGLFPNGDPGGVPIVAPEGFMDHAISENVYAGVAMGRRALDMYGVEIGRSKYASVDAGLGKNFSVGTNGVIKPTLSIKESTPAGVTVPIAGIEFVFQLTPDTEAPSEMNFYLPAHRALCMAENATPTLHNIYSLRGAQVRDAKAWSVFLNQTAAEFGPKTDALFASHFWPRWSNNGDSTIVDFLTSQADLYRFLHDQALHRANQGYTAIDLAEDLDDAVPQSLAGQWFNRGYYGTTNHNLKAIYQRYLGWFDGNASHLHGLDQRDVAMRYVTAMGGPDAAFALADTAFKEAQSEADYRWAAELFSHITFAYPHHDAARAKGADVLEQLGYLSESGPWRNFYLAAAQELRLGYQDPKPAKSISADMIAAMSVQQVFDFFGIRLRGTAVTGPLSFRLAVVGDPNVDPDKEPFQYWIRLRNCVVVYTDGAPTVKPDAAYQITRAGLNQLALGNTTPDDLAAGDDPQLVMLDGSSIDTIRTFYGYMVTFYGNWPLNLPRQPQAD